MSEALWYFGLCGEWRAIFLDQDPPPPPRRLLYFGFVLLVVMMIALLFWPFPPHIDWGTLQAQHPIKRG